MSYDNLSSVSQNVLKFYQQLTGEERRVPFIIDWNKHQKKIIKKHDMHIQFYTAKRHLIYKNKQFATHITPKKKKSLLMKIFWVCIKMRLKIE